MKKGGYSAVYVWVSCACLALFCAGTFLILERDWLSGVNLFVYQEATLVHREWLTALMSAVSNILHPAVIFMLAVFSYVYLNRPGERKFALVFIFSTSLSLFSAFILKLIFNIERPEGIVVALTASYPSIHAAAATSFLASSVYTLRKHFDPGFFETLFTIVGACLIILTSASRLYLQVHWVSDIVGGIILGIFWTTLFIGIFANKK